LFPFPTIRRETKAVSKDLFAALDDDDDDLLAAPTAKANIPPTVTVSAPAASTQPTKSLAVALLDDDDEVRSCRDMSAWSHVSA
jgi:hypothetical protein